jgi:predicted GNAT family acetyltransferase
MIDDTTPSGTAAAATGNGGTDNEVSDNRAESRYELTVRGETAIAAYDLDTDSGVIAFTHTAVPAALGGQGVATRLIDGAIADVDARKLKVRPLCSFVADWFDRHPEKADMLA